MRTTLRVTVKGMVRNTIKIRVEVLRCLFLFETIPYNYEMTAFIFLRRPHICFETIPYFIFLRRSLYF